MFEKLLDFIFPVRTDEEIVRELTLEKFLSIMEPELEERTKPHTVALFPFADRRVRAVIHEAKYHGNTKAFDLLAAALVEYLQADTLDEACLVPVPLGPKRFRERGFNQAEEVAKRVAKEINIGVETGVLIRTRETASQVSLPREARMQNMQGAFGALKKTDPSLTYILLDDVLTTGATLQSATDTLTRVGALKIILIALAH